MVQNCLMAPKLVTDRHEYLVKGRNLNDNSNATPNDSRNCTTTLNIDVDRLRKGVDSLCKFDQFADE